MYYIHKLWKIDINKFWNKYFVKIILIQIKLTGFKIMPTQPKLEFKSADSSKLDKNLKVIALYDKKCDKITKK